MKVFGLDANFAKNVSGVLIVGAVVLFTYAIIANPEGVVRRYWARYVAFLGRKLRSMFIFTPPQTIAWLQVAGLIGIFAAWLLVDLPFAWVFALAVCAVPPWQIERMRKQRVEKIEDQIDGFVLALANALKSTPSIGDAFKSVAVLTAEPLKKEIELAIKEMRVGSTLDQAILLMASRVGSRPLDSALSAILVGRQVGGNLPKILETTANSLREMKRLEGVVRTKTAEGKMQLWVLAIFPFLLVLAINAVSPGYFDPLTSGIVGYILVIIASLFWIASLVVARKILAVDI